MRVDEMAACCVAREHDRDDVPDSQSPLLPPPPPDEDTLSWPGNAIGLTGPVLHPTLSDAQKYTVGWICAITTEAVAAQAFLDEEQDGPQHVSLSRLAEPGVAMEHATHRVTPRTGNWWFRVPIHCKSSETNADNACKANDTAATQERCAIERGPMLRSSVPRTLGAC
ncbi:hypothetical protein EDB81DRAFT_886083 [Dactylonectria macrodidyma]|uniref:Uncharacterized protein n=1 Tax=Dactylonectria macrodidyma TaxID=307937 RepID=A0A9P9EHW2_9HYPO|nr:hypothetical protein EDB81DRAFT_886083 [Dactylonectria macrodidyma]